MLRLIAMTGVLAALTGAVGTTTEVFAADTMQTSAQAALFQQRDGLPNVMAKLRAGQEVRIAYFGGSITAANGWRPKTLDWFKRTYPAAKITEINAAISGTGSDLGVYRFRQDVLQHNPDLVFVEFSVNDGGANTDNIRRGMEGMVRQAWRTNPNIDFCYVYTFRVGYEQQLRQGTVASAPNAHEDIAKHYGIPSVNVALRISQLEQEGKLAFEPAKDQNGAPPAEGKLLFSNDGIHPLEGGHLIYSEVISNALGSLPQDAAAKAHAVPTPLMADNWEGARLVPITQTMLSPGWSLVAAGEPETRFKQFLPQVWKAVAPGETMNFRFKGTAARIYDISGQNGGFAKVTLDGVAGQPQARFDRYAKHLRLTTLRIGEKLPDTEHTVKIELQPEQPDRRIVTDIEGTKPGFNPKDYDGTVLRFGSIMVLGEILD